VVVAPLESIFKTVWPFQTKTFPERSTARSQSQLLPSAEVKSALRPTRTKFDDGVAAGIGRCHFRDVDIATSVDSQAAQIMKSVRESAPGSVGTKFKDSARAAGHDCTIHHKEIASCVKGQAHQITKSGSKGALGSIGSEFEDHACETATLLICLRRSSTLPHKEIARTIKGHRAPSDACDKGTLLSVRCELVDRLAAGVRDEKIAFGIKGEAG
jgi:hypothetical protein